VTEDHATPAEEEYLQIIYWLMEAELPITGANIARAMRLSPPTVHEMLGRLEQDGYVTRAEDKSLRFTDEGMKQAEAIVGRHRLIERFLTDVVGIAWDDVHEEAERLEHAMSPAFEKWMISSVGDAKTCPHGHPIEPGKRVPGVPLADVAVGAEVEILRFENEAEDILHYLKQSGLHPGLTGKLAQSGADEVIVRSNGSSVSITRSVAETISVKADPSPPPRTALPEQLVVGKDRYGR
jgi:DtxR family transcriptional regulator, iron-dependent repressor